MGLITVTETDFVVAVYGLKYNMIMAITLHIAGRVTGHANDNQRGDVHNVANDAGDNFYNA